ncbi:MAG: DUF1223 domain-containing protein [Pseudomonadota bacterium]
MKRPLIGAVALLFLAGSTGFAQEPRAFLELFTSQGCAACPAADKLVGEFAEEDDVLAVTMPVKLWDFLGWRDTLATDGATKRQMAYSVARGDMDVFTPQLVVNGKTSVIGSDRDAVAAAIDAAPAAGLPLPIDLSVAGGVLSVDVGEGKIGAAEATLWFIVVEREVSVPVGGGENRGRELTYHNVVRQMRPIGMYKGKAMSLDLPLSDLEKAPNAACFVIAQVETFKGPGRVVGAAELKKLFPARVVQSNG